MNGFFILRVDTIVSCIVVDGWNYLVNYSVRKSQAVSLLKYALFVSFVKN